MSEQSRKHSGIRQDDIEVLPVREEDLIEFVGFLFGLSQLSHEILRHTRSSNRHIIIQNAYSRIIIVADTAAGNTFSPTANTHQPLYPVHSDLRHLPSLPLGAHRRPLPYIRFSCHPHKTLRGTLACAAKHPWLCLPPSQSRVQDQQRPDPRRRNMDREQSANRSTFPNRVSDDAGLDVSVSLRARPFSR